MLSSEDVKQMCQGSMTRVCSALGIDPVPLRPSGRVVLFRAFLQPDGFGNVQPEVQFNPDTLRRELNIDCDDSTCNTAIVLWHMGHEVSHITSGDLLSEEIGSRWQAAHKAELVADFQGGWVLGRLGVPPDDVSRMLQRLSPEWTRTHPAARVRSSELMKGYAKGLADRPRAAPTGTLSGPRIGFASGYAPPGYEGNLIEEVVHAAMQNAGIEVDAGTLHGARSELPPYYEYRGFGYPPGTPNSLLARRSVQHFLTEARSYGVSPARIEGFLRNKLPVDQIWAYDYMGYMGPLSGAIGYYLIRGDMVVGDLVLAVS